MHYCSVHQCVHIGQASHESGLGDAPTIHLRENKETFHKTRLRETYVKLARPAFAGRHRRYLFPRVFTFAPCSPRYADGNSVNHLIAGASTWGDDQNGGPDMRRDDLMKPDLFSEVILTAMGLAIFLFIYLLCGWPSLISSGPNTAGASFTF
jgi:hypothetical protein